MENKREMKSVIYEFDPVIYPTRLWVCKKPETKDVEELFYPFSKKQEELARKVISNYNMKK